MTGVVDETLRAYAHQCAVEFEKIIGEPFCGDLIKSQRTARYRWLTDDDVTLAAVGVLGLAPEQCPPKKAIAFLYLYKQLLRFHSTASVLDNFATYYDLEQRKRRNVEAIVLLVQRQPTAALQSLTAADWQQSGVLYFDLLRRAKDYDVDPELALCFVKFLPQVKKKRI